eukprot:6670771-Pyramimonas_sp.AAC.1
MHLMSRYSRWVRTLVRAFLRRHIQLPTRWIQRRRQASPPGGTQDCPTPSPRLAAPTPPREHADRWN